MIAIGKLRLALGFMIAGIILGFTIKAQASLVKFSVNGTIISPVTVSITGGNVNTSVTLSVNYDPYAYANIDVDCGVAYKVVVVSGSPNSTTVSITTPAGCLWETGFPVGDSAYPAGGNFDSTKVSVNGLYTGGTYGPKTWTYTLRPKGVRFSQEPLSNDGKAISQASLTISSGVSWNTAYSSLFKSKPTWSIVGDSLGCTIDTNGVIRAGTKSGEIAVRATDSSGKYLTGALRIGCQSCGATCPAGSRGCGQGILENSKYGLAVSTGVLLYGDSYMGAIRLNLDALLQNSSTNGLVYDQDCDQNDLPFIYRDANGLRQVFAPQCLVDVTTNASGYSISFYRTNAAGTLSGGLYSLKNSPTPFKVWRVASLGATQYCVVEDPSGGNRTNTFTWSDQDQSWTLNGSGLEQERRIVSNQTTNSGETARRSETIETSVPGDSKVAARSTKTYATLDFSGNPVADVLMEERADGRTADGSAANPDVVTSYSYASTPTTEGHPKLQRMSRSDGYWEHYAYSNDLITTLYTPWGNSAAPSDPSTAPTSVAHKETVYDYTLLSGDSGTDLVTPRKTEVYVKDSTSSSLQPVSLSYVLLTVDSNSTPRLKVRTDIVCASSSAAWNDTNNLVTVTRSYLDGAYKDSIRSIDRPDGTRSVYTYGVTNATNTTIVEEVGAANPTTNTLVTDGTRTKTTYTDRGYVVLAEQWDIVSGKKLASDAWSQPDQNDLLGRFTVLTHMDGTTEHFTYDCCTLTQQTDREGVATTITPDVLKRPRLTAVYGIQTQNNYDAAGNITNIIRFGSTTVSTLPSRSIDRAGRTISEQNALGGTNLSVESTNASGGRVVTTTNPDLSTRIDEYYCDGRLYRTYGTGVQPQQWEYGFDATAGLLFTKNTKLDTNSAPTTEWTKTYIDFLGREFKTVYADATGSPYSQDYFNSQGQRWKQKDPDGNITAYIFNARGEIEYTMTGLETEPQTPLTSPDITGNHPVQRVQTLVTNYTDGGTVYDTIVTRTTEWTTTNSTATLVFSEVHTSLDGLRQWNVAYPGDACQQVTRSVTQYGTATKTVTVTYPDSSYAVTLSTNGRLSSVTRFSSNAVVVAQTSYSYDGDGHVYSKIDVRSGASTFLYNNADLVRSITSPTPGAGGTAQTATYGYDQAFNLTNSVEPDSTSMRHEFYGGGLPKKDYGSRIFPAAYSYDAQFRPRTLTTWTNYSGGTGAAATTWAYDPYRGWLTSKQYQGNATGPSYSYYNSGLPLSRTLARNITATKGYTTSGQLSWIAFSDGTGTTNIYDRRGRVQSVAETGGATTALYYSTASLLSGELHAGGSLNGVRVTNVYDSFLRRGTNISAGAQTVFTYDDVSRLKSVSDGTNSATYTYVTNSSLIDNIVFAQNGVTRATIKKQYDLLNRLTNIVATTNAVTVFSSFYTFNNANQRTTNCQADGSRWVFGYDSLGQLNSAKKYWSDGTAVAGQQFEYVFDDIGNRRTVSEGGNAAGTGLRQAAYSPTLLNQDSQRTVPNSVDVIGNANQSATVTVNGQRPYRNGTYFRDELTIDNSTVPAYQGVTNLAVVNNGTNADIVSSNIGNIFLPKTPEVFGYDADGNLTNDGRWAFSWDAQNRLTNIVALSATPTAAKAKLDFIYDYQGRRIQKTVSTLSGTNYVVQNSNTFVYDGGNLVAIRDTNGALYESFRWGLDLSGTRQGAGGVGGIISMTVHSGPQVGTYFYCHDGNGNVVGLIRASDGAVVARYEYEPFGKLLRASGPVAFLNPFLFSSKFYDWETGLYYFGARYYSPSLGNWLNRDPLGEQGGLNLYGFAVNSPVTFFDPNGSEANTVSSTIAGLSGAWASDAFSPGGLFYAPGAGYVPNSGSAAHSARGLIASIQIIGAGVEAVGGVALFIAPEPTMATKVGGGILLANAADHIKTAFTGEGYYEAALKSVYGKDNPYISAAVGLKDFGTAPLSGGSLLSASAQRVTVSQIPQAVKSFVRQHGNACQVQITIKPATAPTVEQYSLRAAESGHYPVMFRGADEPVFTTYLHKGDVWKFGTTKNPGFRYSQNFLDSVGDYGVQYSTEFSGTAQQSVGLQNMKIENFLLQKGKLPPGNKIVN